VAQEPSTVIFESIAHHIFKREKSENCLLKFREQSETQSQNGKIILDINEVK